MAAYARKAVELVQEVAACDEDQLLPYNVENVNQALKEVNEHHQQLLSALLVVQESGVEWDRANISESAAILVHHQALLRNKRCLLAYMHERMWRIRRFRWQLGAKLPSEIEEKMSNAEREYFRSYSDIVGQYMGAVGTELNWDLTPPKDPYIEVRVLKDLGEVMLESKVAHLERNTVHLLRRAEAEPLIMQGILEHREY